MSTEFPLVPSPKEVIDRALTTLRDVSLASLHEPDDRQSTYLADLATSAALRALLNEHDAKNAQLLSGAGVSWEAIGKSLGITDVAARKRYGTSEGIVAARARKPKPAPKEGMSVVEAAAKLGVSSATVKNHITAARNGQEERVVTPDFVAVRYPIGNERFSWRIFDLKN
jgi:biotin operon repressor